MGRRSFKVASGVKVNVNERSVGLTVGGKRARYTVNSKGRSTDREPGAGTRGARSGLQGPRSRRGLGRGVIRLTAGLLNEDDVTLALRLMQVGAMEHKGLDEAAIEVYKDALRSSKRNGDLLTVARYQRAKTYLRLGNRRQALRDLNRLYADQPDYEDVGALLEELTRSGGQSAPLAS